MKKDPAIARVGFLTENRSRAWCVPPPGYSEKRFYLSRSYSTIMSLGKFSRSAPLVKQNEVMIGWPTALKTKRQFKREARSWFFGALMSR